MRRADRPRDGVVHIAGLGGLVAVGKATRQIAHPDELVERGGRPVLRLGFIEELRVCLHGCGAADLEKLRSVGVTG